jgi:hypothetical protein
VLEVVPGSIKSLVFICRVRHSANRSLCRVPDEIRSAKHVTLGKERVSGSDTYITWRARRIIRLITRRESISQETLAYGKVLCACAHASWAIMQVQRNNAFMQFPTFFHSKYCSN